MRTDDVDLVVKATSQYAEEIKGFDPPEWLADGRNIALVNDNEDIALFEHFKEGVVCGHYFFFSRGRAAIKAAKQFLDELFNNYDVKVIVGLTPMLNKKAKWMNRQLGFKYHGAVVTEVEPCEIVMLTKEDWQQRCKGDNE